MCFHNQHATSRAVADLVCGCLDRDHRCQYENRRAPKLLTAKVARREPVESLVVTKKAHRNIG